MNNRAMKAIPVLLALILFVSGCATIPGAADLRLRTGRYGHAAVTDGKMIYVIGGSGPDGLLGDIEAIDPWSGRREVITTNLIPRRYHSAVIKRNRIYIVGGESGPMAQPVIETFDLKSRKIKMPTLLPTPRRLAQAALIGNDLYVIGGQDQKQLNKKSNRRTGMVEVYDIVGNKWRSAPLMPTPRECAVVAGHGKIYAIGGYTGGKTGLTAFETYDPKAGKWIQNPDIPFPLSSGCALLLRNRIFTFGDYKKLNRVASCSLRNHEWTELDIDYRKSRHNACVRIGDEIFVIGGNITSSDSHLDMIQRFKVPELLKAKERAAPKTEQQ
ncbi:MAG: Kelch repeat-containing protein [Kiritimatiellia bacterium]